MKLSKVKAHGLDVGHFLSLKAIQVGLDRSGRISQVYSECLECLVELRIASR